MTTHARLMATAVAALLAAGAAHAQQAQDGGDAATGATGAQPQAQGQAQQAQDQAQAGQGTGGQDMGGQDMGASAEAAMGPDTLIVTVGEERITGADVVATIDTLPPQLRQQPPALLIPMAVDSLVTRELILQEARAQNLAEDPEVRSLADASAEIAEEDAMVQVYLQRELESRVTDEAVQGAYDALAQSVQAQGAQTQLPPLEQVRPQIERQLQQQALQGLRSELASDVAVVFYGPDGQPMQAQPSPAGGGQPMGETQGQPQGGASGAAPQDGQASDAQPSEAQPSDTQ
jgi:hypothetical protein